MNNETFYVGLDLECYQVVMNERGKIVRSRPFATSELLCPANNFIQAFDNGF